MEINIKMCIVGIFITLTGCTKQNSDAIFVQESNKNYSKYNFIINDRLFFFNEKRFYRLYVRKRYIVSKL